MEGHCTMAPGALEDKLGGGIPDDDSVQTWVANMSAACTHNRYQIRPDGRTQ